MKKILIVEDDDILFRMYSQKLTNEKYNILRAKDGKNGLEIARFSKPDLIILDIMLPGGLNGFDVLEDLKRSDLTKNIPVIVLTNLEAEEKTAQEIGAMAYFVKSKIKTDELVKKVNEIL